MKRTIKINTIRKTLLSNVAFLVGFIAWMGRAQEPSPDDRLKHVQEEYDKRRQQREAIYESNRLGGVFQPFALADFGKITLQIESTPIRDCAQTYANLTNCEVMISAKIASKRISVQSGVMQIQEAREKINQTMVASGIAIVPIGKSIIVLVDASAIQRKE